MPDPLPLMRREHLAQIRATLWGDPFGKTLYAGSAVLAILLDDPDFKPETDASVVERRLVGTYRGYRVRVSCRMPRTFFYVCPAEIEPLLEDGRTSKALFAALLERAGIDPPAAEMSVQDALAGLNPDRVYGLRDGSRA